MKYLVHNKRMKVNHADGHFVRTRFPKQALPLATSHYVSMQTHFLRNSITTEVATYILSATSVLGMSHRHPMQTVQLIAQTKPTVRTRCEMRASSQKPLLLGKQIISPWLGHLESSQQTSTWACIPPLSLTESIPAAHPKLHCMPWGHPSWWAHEAHHPTESNYTDT